MSELVQILDGNTFVVSDTRRHRGVADGSDRTLLVRHAVPVEVGPDRRRTAAQLALDRRPPVFRDALLPRARYGHRVRRREALGHPSASRRRRVPEELTILNHDEKPVDSRCGSRPPADFADLFEVKDALKKQGKYSARSRTGALRLAYERETTAARRRSRRARRRSIDEHGADVHAAHRASRRAGRPTSTWSRRLGRGRDDWPAEVRRGAAGRRGRTWRESLDTMARGRAADSSATGSRSSRRTGAASSTSPRFASRRRSRPGKSLPAAGLPWFMTMFGRDSIFTSLQALPFTPELAATTLRALGDWQGSRVDDFRDEDPGRILHEMRYGEMTAFEERPHSPYYGSADATPLYVVLLDEYERWTGDTKLVRDLEYQARAALNWIDEYADLRATATSHTSAATRRQGSRTSAGRTRGIRSRTRDGATARLPACDL